MKVFFNSLTRRVFATEGVDQAIEFVDSDFDAPPTSSPLDVRRIYSGAALPELISAALDHFHRWLSDFSSIAVVIIMAMMAVVSSTPVVRGVSVATVIRIWLGIRVVRSPIVPVGIIIVACRISVIAAWEPKTDSHPGNPDSHLSVSTLAGNQSQPAYRQSNQEKLFHRFTSSVCFRSSVCCFARNETARLPLPWNRKLPVARF